MNDKIVEPTWAVDVLCVLGDVERNRVEINGINAATPRDAAEKSAPVADQRKNAVDGPAAKTIFLMSCLLIMIAS